MITPESQSRSWGIKPRWLAWPGQLDGMTLAVFGGSAPEGLVLSAPADPDCHVLTVSLSPHVVDMDIDGRPVNRGPISPGQVMMVRPGERPDASIQGHWHIAQYYIPDALFAEVATALGLRPGRLDDLLGPRFARDFGLLGFSARLMARLSTKVSLSRMELDEFGLMLVEHVLRGYLPEETFSKGNPLEANRRLGSLLEDYLHSGAKEGILDFAKAFDLSVPEVLGAIRARHGSGH